MHRLSRRTRPLAKYLALLLAVGLLLAGCWDRKEVEDMGFVVAIGLDQGPDGTVVVTFQVAIPRAMVGSSGTGGGGGGQGGAGTPPAVVETIAQKTVYEAIRNLETKVNRRISLVQVRLVVLGNDLAKNGVSEHIGLLTRHRELRETVMVMVAENKAEEILRLNPVMERDPSLFLEDLTRRAYERTAWAPRVNLHQFLLAYETLGRDPILPVVHRRMVSPGLERAPRASTPTLRGTAVFRDDRMVCLLSPRETEMLLMLMRRMRSFVSAMPIPENPDQEMAVELSTEALSTKVDISGPEPAFTIFARTEGEIKETDHFPSRYATPAGLNELSALLGKRLEDRANELAKRMQQECRADPVGLGEALQMRFLDYPSWARYNWHEHFPKAKIQVRVQTLIRRTGMATESPEPR